MNKFQLKIIRFIQKNELVNSYDVCMRFGHSDNVLEALHALKRDKYIETEDASEYSHYVVTQKTLQSLDQLKQSF